MKMKIGQMLNSLYLEPPSGMNMYRMAHLLKLLCQPLQNSWMENEPIMHRLLLSSQSVPSSNDHSRKPLQIVVNFNHVQATRFKFSAKFILVASETIRSALEVLKESRLTKHMCVKTSAVAAAVKNDNPDLAIPFELNVVCGFLTCETNAWKLRMGPVRHSGMYVR